MKVKFYITPKTISQEKQESLNELLWKHPSERSYLSYDQYLEMFSANHAELDSVLSYCKKNQLQASYNKSTREVHVELTDEFLRSINKPDSQNYLTNNNQGDDIAGFSFLNHFGDIHLDHKAPGASNQTNQQKPVEGNFLTKGFVKNFIEKRARLFRDSQQIDDKIPGFLPVEFAKIYNFPEADGENQCIGIIELGGTYLQHDIEKFFEAANLDVPNIEVVGQPEKNPENENIEVTADIQVAGALAPKAKLVVYYGNSILEAVKLALADKKNNPSVLSISWAGSELNYSENEINELNTAFYEASIRGITTIVASGDHGALNNLKFPNVNIPASIPFALGCGGTGIQAIHDKLTNNWVWNESSGKMSIATGGGFSQRIAAPVYSMKASQNYLFQFPQFQYYNSQNGRPIPDVAANAADSSGYSIYYNNKWMKLGGTSLSTPLWAALIARLNQKLGYRLGFINQLLYDLEGSKAFIPSVVGNNGLYQGAWGWNPCTGLGSPDGVELMKSIQEKNNNN